MLGEIFYWIFNMSIVTVICGLPILLIRMIKKIPRRYFVWLWLIPFARMCIPVGISSKYGIMALISRVTTKTVTVYAIADDSAFTMMNCVMGANSYFPITYKFDFLENIFTVASAVWMIVFLVIILTFFIIYFVTVNEIKGANLLKENIYVSDKVRVPLVYGMIKPKIILPHEYEKNDYEYILMHERAHIRRGDHVIRILALIVVCVHWFNPFAWLFLKLLYSDMELACDEAVLAKCSEAQKKEYAHVLLSTAEKVNVFAPTLGGAKVRIRIENILSYRRFSIASAITFSALLLAIAYVLLTNAS
ncbi:MAG: M56 family metallopeptidase [Clostridia bacterium]|nr:M56 family metallopeptidase [Clostridia bacterium]